MLEIKSLSRFHAFAYHLAISIGIALLSTAIVFFVWYPGILAEVSDVAAIFLILLAVDVVLGPVITLIVFNPAKKELKRDLAIVGLIQLTALIYGMYTLFIARPVYTVYNAAGFDLVYANEIKDENLSKASFPEYRSLPFLTPHVIAAQLPKDAGEAQSIMTGTLFGRDDVQHLPQHYLPYGQMKADAIQHAKPLAQLAEFNPEKQQEVQSLIKRYEQKKLEAAYLPLRVGTETYSVIIDKASGKVLEMVNLQTKLKFRFKKPTPNQEKK